MTGGVVRRDGLREEAARAIANANNGGLTEHEPDEADVPDAAELADGPSYAYAHTRRGPPFHEVVRARGCGGSRTMPQYGHVEMASHAELAPLGNVCGALWLAWVWSA
jgi:hypothetical protein